VFKVSEEGESQKVGNHSKDWFTSVELNELAKNNGIEDCQRL